ncbi:FAD-dependent oxidoreductase [Verrucomicrobia bacterium LW23]|nr:FAD-dependent oxidoreductase [Verrucomicrobia bacterium LW23]
METFLEPPRQVRIVADADICVVGGSCTGLFAAIRAARLGARVILIEQRGAFGGVATISLVNVWHSRMDETFERQIFAGLSIETMERLKKRDAVRCREGSPDWEWAFNPFELQIELDEMVRENRIQVMLHTMVVAPCMQDGAVYGVFIENKNGRGLVRAKCFIDATGDGDLCSRIGLETYHNEHPQPPTTCALYEGWQRDNFDIGALMRKHGEEFNLPRGFQWGAPLPGCHTFMLAGTRVTGVDCSSADELTIAEMEGRRQVRATMDLVRKYRPDVPLKLVGLPARLGIRETRHVRALHQLTGQEVLSGVRFPDAIANGSYRVDIHHQERAGLTFQYLSGRQLYIEPGAPAREDRWRPVTEVNPTFYQIPYRCLVPPGIPNLLMAGRMIDADQAAHGAIRVMVNMNQTGEAAGVAAVLALESGIPVDRVDTVKLRAKLAEGGSVML